MDLMRVVTVTLSLATKALTVNRKRRQFLN